MERVGPALVSAVRNGREEDTLDALSEAALFLGPAGFTPSLASDTHWWTACMISAVCTRKYAVVEDLLRRGVSVAHALDTAIYLNDVPFLQNLVADGHVSLLPNTTRVNLQHGRVDSHDIPAVRYYDAMIDAVHCGAADVLQWLMDAAERDHPDMRSDPSFQHARSTVLHATIQSGVVSTFELAWAYFATDTATLNPAKCITLAGLSGSVAVFDILLERVNTDAAVILKAIRLMAEGGYTVQYSNVPRFPVAPPSAARRAGALALARRCTALLTERGGSLLQLETVRFHEASGAAYAPVLEAVLDALLPTPPLSTPTVGVTAGVAVGVAAGTAAVVTEDAAAGAAMLARRAAFAKAELTRWVTTEVFPITLRLPPQADEYRAFGLLLAAAFDGATLVDLTTDAALRARVRGTVANECELLDSSETLHCSARELLLILGLGPSSSDNDDYDTDAGGRSGDSEESAASYIFGARWFSLFRTAACGPTFWAPRYQRFAAALEPAASQTPVPTLASEAAQAQELESASGPSTGLANAGDSGDERAWAAALAWRERRARLLRAPLSILVPDAVVEGTLKEVFLSEDEHMWGCTAADLFSSAPPPWLLQQAPSEIQRLWQQGVRADDGTCALCRCDDARLCAPEAGGCIALRCRRDHEAAGVIRRCLATFADVHGAARGEARAALFSTDENLASTVADLIRDLADMPCATIALLCGLRRFMPPADWANALGRPANAWPDVSKPSIEDACLAVSARISACAGALPGRSLESLRLLVRVAAACRLRVAFDLEPDLLAQTVGCHFRLSHQLIHFQTPTPLSRRSFAEHVRSARATAALLFAATGPSVLARARLLRGLPNSGQTRLEAAVESMHDAFPLGAAVVEVLLVNGADYAVNSDSRARWRNCRPAMPEGSCTVLHHVLAAGSHVCLRDHPVAETLRRVIVAVRDSEGLRAAVGAALDIGSCAWPDLA